jgi:ABC-2 type transport system permease protein
MTRLLREIALWEFRRYFKLRDQLVMLLIGVIVGCGFGAAQKWVSRSGDRPARIVVVAQPKRSITALPGSGLVFEAAGQRSEADLRAMVGRREVDGLLRVFSLDRAELVVAREPVWLPQLKNILTASATVARLQKLNIDPGRLSAAMHPVEVQVTYDAASDRRGGKDARIVAVISVALTLLGLLLGMSYLFAGLTGEKQQRVTEQIVAAVSPQTWVDGKLIGLSAVALASVLVYGLVIAVLILTPRLLNGTVKLTWPSLPPAVLLVFVLLSLLGFLFWFALFAILAVTVDDPNSSSRSGLLFVPFLPLALALTGLRHPDSPAMRILSLFPGTSPTFLSVRMVLGDVRWWEPVLAVALLVICVIAFRRAAGKVFRAAMLMYGKEPGLLEMLRWMRQA